MRPASGTEWNATELPGDGERRLLGIRGDRYTFVGEWSPAGGYETVLQATETT
jgi:hypothetical protein